jgi:hypothetical protein
LLKVDDHVVRRGAVEARGNIGPRIDQVLTAFIAVLKDPYREVTSALRDAEEQIGAPAIPALVAADTWQQC